MKKLLLFLFIFLFSGQLCFAGQQIKNVSLLEVSGTSNTTSPSTANFTGDFYIKRTSTDSFNNWPVIFSGDLLLQTYYDTALQGGAATQNVNTTFRLNSSSTQNVSGSGVNVGPWTGINFSTGACSWYINGFNANHGVYSNSLVFRNESFTGATPNIVILNPIVVSSNSSELTPNLAIIGTNSVSSAKSVGILLHDNLSDRTWKISIRGSGELYLSNALGEHFSIGNSGGIYCLSLSTISGQADVQYNTSTKELGYVSSRREDKMNIETIRSTAWMYQLKPSTFERKNKPGVKENGLIADEVEQVRPELCFYKIKEDGTKELAGVSYTSLITPMLDQIQKLKKKIDELENKIEALESK